jgi:thiosulfate dehydrogenase
MNAFIKITCSASLIAAALGASLSMAVAATAPELEMAVQDGKTMFTHETFEGNGKTCDSCHVGGGVGAGKLPNGKVIPSLSNAAAIFPRFKPMANKVVTLPDQIRGCVQGGLQGKPPAYGSEQLNSLVTYVTSLAQGKPIDMGGMPQ